MLKCVLLHSIINIYMFFRRRKDSQTRAPTASVQNTQASDARTETTARGRHQAARRARQAPPNLCEMFATNKPRHAYPYRAMLITYITSMCNGYTDPYLINQNEGWIHRRNNNWLCYNKINYFHFVFRGLRGWLLTMAGLIPISSLPKRLTLKSMRILTLILFGIYDIIPKNKRFQDCLSRSFWTRPRRCSSAWADLQANIISRAVLMDGDDKQRESLSDGAGSVVSTGSVPPTIWSERV